jgi:diaminopimelate epimerase
LNFAYPAGVIGQGIGYVKGHGTQNDFIVLPDADALLDLTTNRVQALCDRRRGLGADGVLRMVPTELVEEVAEQSSVAQWFMDYRNADGSTSEMCGNGARLFARVLLDHGLMYGESFSIATRGGPREINVRGDDISVEMGRAHAVEAPRSASVTTAGRQWPITVVNFPNPHAVAFVESLEEVGSPLEQPTISPTSLFPEGVNVEFARIQGEDHVGFRVFERGVGETRSCGTGACAVAWAYRQRTGQPSSNSPMVIDVPGGRLRVHERPDGRWVLTGPTGVVAAGTIFSQWWKDNE